MSWFGKDGCPAGVSWIDPLEGWDPDPVIEDARPQEEVAEGVVVERRGLFKLSAAAVGIGLLGSAQATQRRIKTGAAFDFESFLTEALPLARKLVASEGQGEEVYILGVAAMLAKLSTPSGTELRDQMRAFHQANKKDGEHFPLRVSMMRLAPGKGIDHHDHLDYNGIILGLEGEVRIRNYDFIGQEQRPPKGETFLIRETRDDLILPGRFSNLGAVRENIHELVAGPEGARVLDVFTRFNAQARSHMMEFEAQPRDVEKRIHEAAWR